MLRIQMIGLALVAALAMSVVAASSASAAHLWLIGGKLVSSPVKIHSQGLLLLTDDTAPGGAVQVHCKGFDDGTVGPHALDLVLAITVELLGKNDKIPCTFDPGKEGLCKANVAPTALALNLPWHTELYLSGTEVRDMIVSDVGGTANLPGWAVTCTNIIGGTTVDDCTSPLGSVALSNVAGGVQGTFEAKSEAANCKVGTEAVRNGVGLVRGTTLFESPSAGEPLTFD